VGDLDINCNLVLVSNSTLTYSGSEDVLNSYIECLSEKNNLTILGPEQLSDYYNVNGSNKKIEHKVIYPKYFKNLYLTYIARFLYSVRFLKQMKNADYLILFDDYFPSVFFGLGAHLMYRVKIIQIIHHIVPNRNRYDQFYFRNKLGKLSQNLSFTLILKFFGVVIVMNDEAAIFFKTKSYTGKIYKSFPPLDLHFWNNNLKSSTSKLKYFIWIGRLVPTKGCLDLEEICKELSKERDDIKIKIYAKVDKQSSQEIQIMNRFKKLNNVMINADFVSKDFLKDEMINSLGLINTSKEEGFSLTTAQALALDKPVFAFDELIYREHFGEACYFLTSVFGFIQIMKDVADGNFIDSAIKRKNVIKFSRENLKKQIESIL
jgi:glycosyltransferase involved in cell wall biosynthesis